MLDQVADRFDDELDITVLLKKIRDSYDLIKNLQSKQ